MYHDKSISAQSQIETLASSTQMEPQVQAQSPLLATKAPSSASYTMYQETDKLAAPRRCAIESTHGNDTERNSSKELPPITTSSTVLSSAAEDYDSSAPCFTIQQNSLWKQRVLELLEFHQENGHCCVPSRWPRNASLAQWVKRQRTNYKLKKGGVHSNLTNDREKVLQDLGFVWDTNSVFWEDRLNDLRAFREQHLHGNVPPKYPQNQQLAIWAKCQRRQFKLFSQADKRSTMSLERISKLAGVGFVFNPIRKKKRPPT
jgi:hypothetical protein